VALEQVRTTPRAPACGAVRVTLGSACTVVTRVRDVNESAATRCSSPVASPRRELTIGGLSRSALYKRDALSVTVNTRTAWAGMRAVPQKTR